VAVRAAPAARGRTSSNGAQPRADQPVGGDYERPGGPVGGERRNGSGGRRWPARPLRPAADTRKIAHHDVAPKAVPRSRLGHGDGDRSPFGCTAGLAADDPRPQPLQLLQREQ
jgi:hypothetical protein